MLKKIPQLTGFKRFGLVRIFKEFVFLQNVRLHNHPVQNFCEFPFQISRVLFTPKILRFSVELGNQSLVETFDR